MTRPTSVHFLRLIFSFNDPSFKTAAVSTPSGSLFSSYTSSAKLLSFSHTVRLGCEEETISAPKKKKKKKHKKKIKLDDEYEEKREPEGVETAAVLNEGSLKLKISLKK